MNRGSIVLVAAQVHLADASVGLATQPGRVPAIAALVVSVAGVPGAVGSGADDGGR